MDDHKAESRERCHLVLAQLLERQAAELRATARPGQAGKRARQSAARAEVEAWNLRKGGRDDG